MKLFTLFHFTVLALITTGLADDGNSERKDVMPVASPLSNPWDANAWEAGSGESFWKAKTKKPVIQASRPEKSQLIAKKGSEKQFPEKQTK